MLKKKLAKIIGKIKKNSISKQTKKKIGDKKNISVHKKKKSTKKSTRGVILNKLKENPIISPRPENNWESWQVFNPGVILINDKVHFVYRAIGEDGISRLGYAISSDGFTIEERLPYPVYEHITAKKVFNIYSYLSGGSWGGAEDPRLVRVGEEDVIYMTYTACDNGLRVGLTSLKVDDLINKKWYWKPPVMISPLNEIHKNWIIFPEKINGKYAILHSIKPSIQIEYIDSLEFDDDANICSFHGGPPRKKCWDKWIRGPGTPPLKTKDGWLLFYHAMDDDWSKYRVGAMLLDLKDPTKILYRARAPVLEPRDHYENSGCKPGVVYASGSIIKDNNLLIYYGCSDSYVGVAHSNLDEFLDALKKEEEPKLKSKILKKR